MRGECVSRFIGLYVLVARFIIVTFGCHFCVFLKYSMNEAQPATQNNCLEFDELHVTKPLDPSMIIRTGLNIRLHHQRVILSRVKILVREY